MNKELLKRLSAVSSEEREILNGRREINERLYMASSKAVVDSARLLESGRLITVRPHTRFVHFPEHTHNYVEMIYMCRGLTVHIINGTRVELNTGELLLLNQYATQEILPAREEDVAVNFIILPEFFDKTLQMMGAEGNLVRDFIVDCLKNHAVSGGYLHFKVAEVLPIQNLVENLLDTLVNKEPNRRSMNQYTMGLLFLHLMNHVDKIQGNQEQTQLLTVLRYVEEHYRNGQLRELAQWMNYDPCWLSREIKRQTGMNFTELIQTKRLNHAAFLLTATTLTVAEIGERVGYENLSYFHRIFAKRFGVSPHKYRKKQTQQD